MSQLNQNQVADTEIPDSRWRIIYIVAGIAALITGVIIVLQMVFYIISPLPNTVSGFFELFQENRFLGLLSLDLLYVIDNVLLIPILLALYVSLRKLNNSSVLLGSFLTLIGIMALFASNTSVDMLLLSNKYAAATIDTQKSLFLGAGEALYANYMGTSYNLHLILASVGLIIISFVMLRSKIFSKATAYMGILGNAVALGYYVPQIGKFLLVFSVLFLEVWYILMGLNFLKLRRLQKSQMEPVK